LVCGTLNTEVVDSDSFTVSSEADVDFRCDNLDASRDTPDTVI
jgi:hypothetical protein